MTPARALPGAVVLAMLLLLCCSAKSAPASRKQLRSIDCRRLVFHPQCRGVAAKRSMPNLLDGLESQPRYQPDTLRDAVEPLPAPAPPAPGPGLRGPGGPFAALSLSSDPLLASLLGRLAAMDESRRPTADGVPTLGGDRTGDRAADRAADSESDAWTSAMAADQRPSKAADLGHFDWQTVRKRMKEQEIAYDY